MHLAVATSLGSIILTSVSSLLAHHRHGAVAWPVVLQLAPGLVLGSLGGALFASSLTGDVLTLVFACFCLLAGSLMLRASNPVAGGGKPGTAATLGASGAKGLSAQRAVTLPAALEDDPMSRGRTVFEEMECQSCHLVDGVGEAYGPDLTHVAGRVRDDYLEPFLRNPARLYPAAEMSPFDGSNEELRALLAYLRSLE